MGLGGLGGLGEAMGSVGTVFGLGGSPRAEGSTPSVEISSGSTGQGDEQVVQVDVQGRLATAADQASPAKTLVEDSSAQQRTSGLDAATQDLDNSDGMHTGASQDVSTVDAAHHVEQSPVALPELEAAVQSNTEIDLTWDHRGVFLNSGDSFHKRRLSWIIVSHPTLPSVLAHPFSFASETVPCSSSFSLHPLVSLTNSRPADPYSPSTPSSPLFSQRAGHPSSLPVPPRRRSSAIRPYTMRTGNRSRSRKAGR